MKNNLDNPKYINILGTTCSGTGAVFDYLYGRGDLYDPLFGEEYLLPALPNGLMALEAISDKAFDSSTTEYSLNKFKSIGYKLMHYWANKNQNNELNKNIPIFKEAIESFVNEISFADFPMRLLVQELMQSPIQSIVSKFKNRLGINRLNPQTRLLVSQKEFVAAAQKMHNRMFQTSAKGRPIILNRGGSGWNPAESTKYFSNCKVVLVTRDPRDQFVELRLYKQATSIEGFVDWYKEMQRRLKLINEKNILFIRFEDFVKKNEEFTQLLCNHVSLSFDVSSNYQPELSKKNIGKFHQLLTNNEIKIIENSLAEYIYLD